QQQSAAGRARPHAPQHRNLGPRRIRNTPRPRPAQKRSDVLNADDQARNRGAKPHPQVHIRRQNCQRQPYGEVHHKREVGEADNLPRPALRRKGSRSGAVCSGKLHAWEEFQRKGVKASISDKILDPSIASKASLPPREARARSLRIRAAQKLGARSLRPHLSRGWESTNSRSRYFHSSDKLISWRRRFTSSISVAAPRAPTAKRLPPNFAPPESPKGRPNRPTLSWSTPAP